MMNMCLFNGISSSCSNAFTEEHIIQKGLGGTLKSKNIICESCNQYFGNFLDPSLVDFYSPIIQIIQPLLSGDLKGKKRNRTSLNEGDSIKILPGGHAELCKDRKKHFEKGQKLEVIAPLKWTREKIEKKYGKRSSSFDEDYIEDDYHVSLEINDTLLRAIALNMLELLKYVCLKNKMPDLSTHPDLTALKKWVRTGNPEKYIRSTKFPFAPVSDIMASIFKPCMFSHKFIIYYDHLLNKLLFLAEYLDTMPWIMILDDINIFSSSLFIKYQKKLTDFKYNQEEPSIVPKTLFNWKEIEWRVFSTVSYESRLFARNKLVQQHIEQIGRARYEVDMQTEDTLIKHMSLILRRYRNDKLFEIAPKIVSELIKINYKYSPLCDEIKNFSLKKAQSMSAATKENMIELGDLIPIYRTCQKMIVLKGYGYPQMCLPDNP